MKTFTSGTLYEDIYKRHFTWRHLQAALYMKTFTSGTLHEDIYTFVIISRWNLLRMKIFSGRIREENQNTYSTRGGWRRWSLRFFSIRPTALTWRLAISISFLTSRGISRGLISPRMMKWSKLWRRGSNKELLNSLLTACVNLFYVGKNVLKDKESMSKNKYVNLYLKYYTLLPTFFCLNTWSLFLDISLCALLISRPS